MTDANQALVWDAVYTPFGQVHSITGTATNNQRFPGQYADAETGFNYNYFRDYDPTTGRYIQSDPIGLWGGLNRYVYGNGDPQGYIDPFGLKAYVPDPPVFPNDLIGSNQKATVVCQKGLPTPRINPTVLNDPENQKCGINDCLITHELVHAADAFQSNQTGCKGKTDNASIFFPETERNNSEFRAHQAEINCLKEKLKNATCECEKALTNRLVEASVGQGRFQ